MRVLHFLTQRPGWTGSGTTLHALVDWARCKGIDQRVLCLLPVGEVVPQVGGLGREQIDVLDCGEGGTLPFAIPGMSDVMPYASTVFGEMSPEELRLYCQVLRSALQRAIDDFQPDVIHAHHAWIGAGIACELAGSTPVVLHGHGTGLRQMGLLPHLEDRVRNGLQNIAGICVLHQQHAQDYARVLRIGSDRVHQVGAGFDRRLFQAPVKPASPGTLLFAGKFADAKGLGPLLEAFRALRMERPHLELAIAGAGSGEQGKRLLRSMEATEGVRILGRLTPGKLAIAMGQAEVFVLPSLFEGLPLVLVEAAACGCRLVSNDLPGVRSGLAAALADRMHLCPLPKLVGPDRLAPGAASGFTEDLARVLGEALDAGPAPRPTAETCAAFDWSAVAEKVERVWMCVTDRRG